MNHENFDHHEDTPFEKRNVIIRLRIGLETKERAPGSWVSREASTSADLYEGHPDEEHTFVEPVERNPDDRYCFPRRGIVLLNTVETFGWILHPGESRWPVSGVENETTPSENRAVFDRWEIRKSFIRSSMMVDRFRSWYLINYKPRWVSRDDIRGQDGNEGLIFKSLHVWIAINLLRGNYWKEEKSKIF